MQKRTLIIGATAAAVAVAAVGAGYSLFGAASYVWPGNGSNRAVQLVSDTGNAGATDDYSGIDFGVPAGLTFGDLDTLSFDYKALAGGCLGGSPRFQINVVDQGGVARNIFVYAGDQPNFTCAVDNTYHSTGDLLDASRTVDTSQLGGTFYDSLSNAQSQYGNLQVTGIQLVVDAGWAVAGGRQEFHVDNVRIDEALYTFEPASKDDCKNQGWKNFTEAPGPFKNQGQCVSYFAKQQPN